MIVPDINVLVYAYDTESPHHARAASWWRSSLEQEETIGLVPLVACGFVRLITNPRVFVQPRTVASAVGTVAAWIARPGVVVLEEGGAERLDRALALLARVGAAGNLVTDARIAALALEHGATICSADSDFSRFPGVRWRNPLRH